MIRWLFSIFIVLSLSFPIAAQTNYDPIYKDTSERHYSPENLVIAERAINYMNAKRYKDCVNELDLILSKPSLNPYEISNTNFIKGYALKNLASFDKTNRQSHLVNAIKAFESSIAARGLMDSYTANTEYKNVAREISSLLRKTAQTPN